MPLHAVLLASALSAVAAAAPPSRLIGSAKEDEPCPEARDVSGRDRALLRALQWAFEPAPMEIRVQAVEDLGLLGDPRALNAAAHLVLDPNPPIAKAAVRAVSLIRDPRAEEILSNVVRHPTIAEATKVLALEALPFQNTWSAVRFLLWSAQDAALPYAVLNAARRVAQTLPPAPPDVPVAPPGGRP